MSKEYLAALKRIKNKFIDFFHEDNPDVECIEDALLELKAIENSKTSEALGKLRELRAKPLNWDTLIKVLDEVEQALLKAQEQESKIEILKDYRKDYLNRLKNLEKHSQEQENILNLIKAKLELKSLDLGSYDIFIKGTDTIFMTSEEDGFETIKEMLE